VTGPAPPFVTFVGSCPDFLSTDNRALNFSDGNAHFHFTQNKNGDWVAVPPTVPLFSPRPSGPAGTISIHAHGHQTTNNAGTPTSNVNAGTVTCI
jgi:hypothetical protein